MKLGASDRAGAFDDLVTALAQAVRAMMQPASVQRVVSLHDVVDQMSTGYEREIATLEKAWAIDSRY